MTTSAQTLKVVRLTHLYFGVFIAPALLFFALTGALQTFSLHETTRGSSYKPAKWIVTLAQLHKKQTTTVTAKKGPGPDKPAGDKGKTDKPDGAAAPKSADAVAGAKPGDAPAPKSHLPMKIFFLLVSTGLFTSTLTGIYMAYKYNRNKVLVTGLLVAGVVLPLLLLPF
jgi:uncharacterized iron-regulated membrane protein